LHRERAKSGSFLRHLQPLQGALEGYSRRALFDASVAADVLQSAIANAYRDFHLYAEGTNFRAWMFRYVHLEVRNWNRKRTGARHEQLPEDVSTEDTWQLAMDEPLPKVLLEDPEHLLDQCDAALAEAVRALTALERSVLLLRAIGEFKYREIAEILQIPIGTVMTSLARGRLRLRQRLAKFGEEHGLLNREAR
jgi:RNA polymerase sigma-70 factor, ECF subfamily